ncbi:hypothetical protein EVAR_18875_1 [Eumeta japonica]|uniref:Uncharacterized protein n=1 Tax=Eumeta variegata TaxID=151549 RepID=A0A4C1V1R1_EUMVA|nr:hypothetical protein EVAR_18875_1 [Eumeta japonica]
MVLLKAISLTLIIKMCGQIAASNVVHLSESFECIVEFKALYTTQRAVNQCVSVLPQLLPRPIVILIAALNSICVQAPPLIPPPVPGLQFTYHHDSDLNEVGKNVNDLFYS